MFKLKRRIMEKNDIERKKEIDAGSFINQIKEFEGDFETINKMVFDEVSKVENNKSGDTYIDVNNARFNYLLLKKEYIDYKYIALQIFLLQQETNGFKYSEISKCTVDIIKFIEDSLLEGKTISFKNQLYISGATDNLVKVNNKWFPRIFISKKKPEGITFLIKDIKIDLKGMRELALYEEVINNFDIVILDLLFTKKQVLLENILIVKKKSNYIIVISKKFLFRKEEKTYNLENTLKSLAKLPNTESNSLPKFVKKIAIKKQKKLVYETQQIFLSRDDKNFKAHKIFQRKEKQKKYDDTKKRLMKIAKKTIIFGEKFMIKKKKKLKLSILNKEIKDIDNLMEGVASKSNSQKIKTTKSNEKYDKRTINSKSSQANKKKPHKNIKSKKEGKDEK